MSFPICPTCHKETKIFAELDPRFGMTRKCGNTGCGAIMPDEHAAQPSREPVQVPEPALVTVDVPRAAARAPAPGGIHADDLLDFARKRLVVVEALLAEKAALEAERKKLRRILKTADPTTPKATD